MLRGLNRSEPLNTSTLFKTPSPSQSFGVRQTCVGVAVGSCVAVGGIGVGVGGMAVGIWVAVGGNGVGVGMAVGV